MSRGGHSVVEIGAGAHAVPHALFVFLALGGGSIVSADPLAVGPHSVGYRLIEAALVFGGRTITASDCAVAAGIAEIGDKALAKVPPALAAAVLDRARAMIEDAVDRMKTEAGDVSLIAVGGGAFLSPTGSPGFPRWSACRTATAPTRVRPSHSRLFAPAVGSQQQPGLRQADGERGAVERQQQIEQSIARLGEGQGKRGVPRTVVGSVRCRRGWGRTSRLYSHPCYSASCRSRLGRFAPSFEDRIGSRRKVRVDALQIAQNVEVKPPRLNGFRPSVACDSEMSLRGGGFDVAEDLFAKQLPRRAGIFRHEHRGGGPRVAGQALDRVPVLVTV